MISSRVYGLCHPPITADTQNTVTHAEQQGSRTYVSRTCSGTILNYCSDRTQMLVLIKVNGTRVKDVVVVEQAYMVSKYMIRYIDIF